MAGDPRHGAWARLRDLPVRIDGYALGDLQREIGPEFVRRCTLVRLRGGGEEGLGEDVTYDAEDHEALQAAPAKLPLAGDWTLGELCARLGELDLFPAPPVRDVSRRYRRWGFESAALDLALRQAGTSLPARLRIEPRPVTYVHSLRLGEPPSLDLVRVRLERYPELRFKLDATSSWDDALVAALADTGAVDSIDFKGLYAGTIVDQRPDPDLYRRVIAGLPDAWLEDPALTDETRPVVEPARDRVTWDANIHGVADIEALPWPPRMVNVKPSRVGSLEALGATYDHCLERGIGMYGGGQTELSVGRGQVQLLAALFHPDTPNDVAPAAFNQPDPPPGLERSPLDPRPAPRGFRRDEA